MNQTMLKSGDRQTKYHILGKIILASCLWGLMLTVSPRTNAQTLSAPMPTQVQDQPTTDSIVKKLMGKWEFTDLKSGSKLNFIFTNDGKLFFANLITSPPQAIQLRYQVANASSNPMQINFSRDEQDQEIVATIFEFTTEGKLRLQMEGIHPKKDRPTSFSQGALLLLKVSDETDLPANTTIKTLRS